MIHFGESNRSKKQKSIMMLYKITIVVFYESLLKNNVIGHINIQNIKKICFFLSLIKKGIRANNDKNWIKLAKIVLLLPQDLVT